VDNRLLALAVTFTPLSLLAFGGGQAIVADIQHQAVTAHGWLTGQQFTDIFAIARAAPGPSTLIVALIGWQVAGFWGALVSTLAIFVPSSLVIYAAGSWWNRHRGSAWTLAVERGLGPIAVGLIFAGALAVMQASNLDAFHFGTIVFCVSVLYFTETGPYPLLAAIGIIYLLVHLAG
jgi:chromate transporter